MNHSRYVFAAAIAVTGLVAAGAVQFLVPSGGSVARGLVSGQPATVYIPNGGTAVWASTDDVRLDDQPCVPSRAEGLTSWSSVRFRVTTTDDDGRQWHGLVLLEAQPPGEHEVTCTVPPGTTLAAGDPPRFHDARAQTIGLGVSALLGLTGLALGGVVAATTITASAIGRPRRRTSGRRP